MFGFILFWKQFTMFRYSEIISFVLGCNVLYSRFIRLFIKPTVFVLIDGNVQMNILHCVLLHLFSFSRNCIGKKLFFRFELYTNLMLLNNL